jgi:hypothetical protein
MKRAGLIVSLLLVLLAGLIATGVSLAAEGMLAVRPAVTPVFGPDVQANTEDPTHYSQHEPGLAVSRVNTNTVVVAAKDYRNNNIKEVWIYVSTDGGATWPANRQLRMPGINAALYPVQSDPVVMARDDGRIYVACLATNQTTSNGTIYITWTDDDGATWQPAVQVAPDDPALDDKEWFAIDNNPASPYYHRMYMMYAPDGAAYVAEQHSTDGGLTWTPRQQIGASNTEYTYPVIASDGTVYNFMMYNWGFGRTGTVQLTKSTNGGVTWSPASTVATAYQPTSPIRSGDLFRFFAILSAAVDPNNGALYVAWTDRGNPPNPQTDVVYVKSTDSGASWGPVTRLSHDPPNTGRDHITPMITVGADSTLHAFWLDRRLGNGPAPNYYFDSWYSSSTDGGATWDPDTRVSTQSQDLNVGLPCCPGNYPAGDYWGLDTAHDAVYVAWNDARSGDQDILVAKGLLPGAGASPTPTLTPGGSTATATATPPPGVTASATAPATATHTASPTPPVVCTPTWRPLTVPDVGPLRAVSASAPDDAWAVGQRSMLRWNGSAWSQVPGSPADMNGVAAVAPNDVWVGGLNTLGHWDGAGWTIVPFPTPMPAHATALPDFVALAAGGPNDVWAAGTWVDMAGNVQILVEHWDGSAWAIVGQWLDAPGAPHTGGTLNYLHDVAVAGPGEAWAVGYSASGISPIVRHCTTAGCTWQTNGIPFGMELRGVAVAGADDVWAVGTLPFSAASGIVRWNGAGWTPVPAPDIGRLNDVVAVGANAAWAVGENGILSWDGTAWTVAVSQAGRPRFGLAATSATDVWAVGALGGLSRIEHTTGPQRFQDVPPTQPFHAFIGWMVCRGYISGYTCGGPGEPCVPPEDLPYFRPGNSVTRGQLLKMVVLAAGWPLVNPPDPSRTFEDVTSGNPFYTFIETGAGRGVISGYDCGGPGEPCSPQNRPYFRWGADITRGQLSKVVALARGYAIPNPPAPTFADVPPAHPFYGFIEAIALNNLVSGYTCGGPGEPCPGAYFRPAANATRGQVAKIVTLAHGGP